ncbi:DUF882 domain-containing protein [Rhizobium sp. L1K21]|nr:DUF882 domain-containing protein [Rhizobium sp. L1K21]MCO6185037.1 DUF882 domain-containing protein [Rhizobium sp. L1K21]
MFLSGLAPNADANAANRSLKLYYVHTGERATITFKRNGKFDKAGLEKLNRFLRDWRRNEPTRMDPRLFDLIWEVYQRTGSNEYINVLSAYRAPQTNSMLRSRSKGVAKNSQHILGKAMDFYIPGVPLKTLREIGLKLQIGGVGYYPTSGSPFVHMDVGGVRAWPRASRQDLVRLFPDGKTMHIPPDGKPLPGYQAALADYKRRVGATSVEVADSAGKTSGKRKNLLQILFGGGDEDEEPESIVSSETVVASAEPAPAPAAARPAAPPQQVATALPGVENFDAPVPGARPAFSAEPDNGAIATALVPPQQNPALEALEAAAVPQPNPGQPEFADLSTLKVPLPELLGERKLPGEAEFELANIDASRLPQPQFRPNEEIAAAETAGADERSSDELAALLNRIGAEEPKQKEEQATEVALLSPEVDEAQPLTRSLAGQVGNDAQTLAAPEQPSALRLAALPSSPDDLAASAASSLAPKKGGRPSENDASAANRTGMRVEPKLTPELVAQWALSTKSVAMETKPVKAPRFVSRVMRAQPKVVYAAGFSTDTQVDPMRFAGNAVNFMKVRKF